jgi:hypothetical protein
MLRYELLGAAPYLEISSRPKDDVYTMYSGSRRWACACVALLAAASSAEAFAYMAGLGQVALRGVGAGSVRRGTVRPAPRPRHRPALVLSMQVQGEEKVKDVEEVTKKYGLEAGLFTALT